MELDSRTKSRRDRMMRSKSFDTQEVREIGRKEAGESRGFPEWQWPSETWSSVGCCAVYSDNGCVFESHDNVVVHSRKALSGK